MLSYIISRASYTRFLVVLDQTGTLYYASLGDDDKKLLLVMKADFAKYNKKKNYGNITFIREEKATQKMKETLELYREIVENPAMIDTIKINYKMINGTPLQYKVWDHLLFKTEASKTTTYGDIARALNMNSFSSRAVGNACGANRIAILVPCHRVLGHNGDITGYKWGTGIKRELLNRERQVKSNTVGKQEIA